MSDTYKGYKISFNPFLPVTGRWRGERFGVGMCANDEAMLKRMIDAKVEENRRELEKRGQI